MAGKASDLVTLAPVWVTLDRKMATLGAFLADIDKEVAYLADRRLISLNLKHGEHGWVIVLLAHGKGGKEVAFVGGNDPIGCYRNLWLLLQHKKVTWKPSKF